MPSILIFESDQALARDLKTALMARNCDVSLVEDAPAGLEMAVNSPPDLVVLCAELPKMNGFTVCNRLRANAALQQVPIIITSSASSEETFQQHRNLPKKRADDYIHKPVTVSSLIERIEQLISLDAVPKSSSFTSSAPRDAAKKAADDRADEDGADEDLDILEAEDLLTDEQSSTPPSPRTRNNGPGSPIGVSSADLDEFAEAAFGSLIQRDSLPPAASQAPAALESATAADDAVAIDTRRSSPPSKPATSAAWSVPPKPILHSDSTRPRPSSPPAEIPSAVRASQAPVSNIPPSFDSLRRSSVPSARGPEEASPALMQLQVELRHAKEQIGDLEEALSASKEREQKLETVYAELDDARARLASGGGGRAKEILDMREQFNRKEKELLDLRDQMTRKEKDLLATKDTALELERRTADAQDRVVEFEKRLHAAERAEQAAIQDRDQAAKRAETHKRKADKLAEEHIALRAEHDELQKLHSDTSADRDETKQELASTQAALSETSGALQDTRSQLTSTQELLTSTAAERDRTNSDLAATNQQLELTSGHLATTEQQLRQTTAQLSDTNAVLEQNRVRLTQVSKQLDDTTSELHARNNDLAATRQELEETIGTLQQTSRQHSEVSQRLTETSETLTRTTEERDQLNTTRQQLEANLAGRTEELTSAHATIAELQGRLGRAEEQLDQSQLQAAELGEQLDRYRVASGELGGLLSDAISKLREIQPR